MALNKSPRLFCAIVCRNIWQISSNINPEKIAENILMETETIDYFLKTSILGHLGGSVG